MLRSGGAAILMRNDSRTDLPAGISFLVGDAQIAEGLARVQVRMPFDAEVIRFLNIASQQLMGNSAAKAFPDVVTFAFWIRKASVMKLQTRFATQGGSVQVGRGVLFHIAPSNVPVNFAYSLAAGLMTGNANAVRVPSKPFPQVEMIADALNHALDECPGLRPYLLLMRYQRDRAVNDWFSAAADVRVVWGGDQTIAELRRSPLPPRSSEITFADRYSLAVVDSDAYLAMEDKTRVAEDFYNDTFLTDQNACTSPRVIAWVGSSIPQAKTLFWAEAHRLVKKKYNFQPIQGVNKLVSGCLAAVNLPGAHAEHGEDNLIFRVSVPPDTEKLMEYRDNSGYFFECDCSDITELRSLCDNKRCQTIAYIGDRNMFAPLLESGIMGIDRIVPLGRTMDFDLIWDGYALPAVLTRTIAVI
ncbi:MAG: acyl-CoA reductase [Ruminococcaceae bacterium]|nr:acyl-CoA reductase [Oscillospiraceae bacterium]